MNIYLTIVKCQYSIVLQLENSTNKLVIVCDVKVVTNLEVYFTNKLFDLFYSFIFNFPNSLVTWVP